MAYETLKFEVADQIATITFSRPEAANSLSLKGSEELHEVATHCASNPDIRAVILTGEGKMFCAGGDVVGFHAQGDAMSEHMRGMTTTLHAAISRFSRMDAPLIIAVNGTAAGAGATTPAARGARVRTASPQKMSSGRGHPEYRWSGAPTALAR